VRLNKRDRRKVQVYFYDQFGEKIPAYNLLRLRMPWGRTLYRHKKWRRCHYEIKDRADPRIRLILEVAEVIALFAAYR